MSDSMGLKAKYEFDFIAPILRSGLCRTHYKGFSPLHYYRKIEFIYLPKPTEVLNLQALRPDRYRDCANLFYVNPKYRT